LVRGRLVLDEKLSRRVRLEKQHPALGRDAVVDLVRMVPPKVNRFRNVASRFV
jgi:hypothetical protein